MVVKHDRRSNSMRRYKWKETLHIRMRPKKEKKKKHKRKENRSETKLYTARRFQSRQMIRRWGSWEMYTCPVDRTNQQQRERRKANVFSKRLKSKEDARANGLSSSLLLLFLYIYMKLSVSLCTVIQDGKIRIESGEYKEGTSSTSTCSMFLYWRWKKQNKNGRCCHRIWDFFAARRNRREWPPPL